MSWTRVEKETGDGTKVDKNDKGHFRHGWFFDWFSGILWKKVEKVEGENEKVIKE